jgi:hypothetical protein
LAPHDALVRTSKHLEIGQLLEKVQKGIHLQQ